MVLRPIRRQHTLAEQKVAPVCDDPSAGAWDSGRHRVADGRRAVQIPAAAQWAEGKGASIRTILNRPAPPIQLNIAVVATPIDIGNMNQYATHSNSAKSLYPLKPKKGAYARPPDVDIHPTHPTKRGELTCEAQKTHAQFSDCRSGGSITGRVSEAVD